MTPPTVLVRSLGRVNYCPALALQKSLATRYKEEQPQGEVRDGHTGMRQLSWGYSVCGCPYKSKHLWLDNCGLPLPQVGELLVCEHDPVFTFGLRQADYETEAAKLRLLGCKVHKVSSPSLTIYRHRYPNAGAERGSDYLPWPRAAGVLPCTEPEEAQGTYFPFTWKC